MKKETRMGLIAAGIVAGGLLLIGVIVFAISSGDSDTNRADGINYELVEAALMSESNGVVFFNKRGEVMLIQRREFYDADDAHEIFAMANNISPEKMRTFGDDCYAVPLSRALGSRYTRGQAKNLIHDWMRFGTYAEIKAKWNRDFPK